MRQTSQWMVKGAALAACAIGLGGTALAQDMTDFGRALYVESCASCHGAGGKGDGPLRAFMSKAPSDLTTLTKRYGGAFPTQFVWEVVDGRTSSEIGPHGNREMPVWGSEFRMQAGNQPELAPKGPEWFVRGRILALLDYLARIQGK